MSKAFMRVVAIIPAVILQIGWYFVLLKWLAKYAVLIQFLLSVFSVIFVLHIISSRSEGTYKIMWLMVIMGMPVFGTVLYLFFGDGARPIEQQIARTAKTLPPRQLHPEIIREIARRDKRFSQTLAALEKTSGYPVTRCENRRFYPLGEEAFPKMLAALEGAEKYIYAEYFIIENGKMWDSMVEIMAKKARQGVDVRVMYDDLGSISTYTPKNMRQLEKLGIKCTRFNPAIFVKGRLNYRDHRKMLVVDGKIAFSGGINLADEYINEKVRFGHWKDIAFRLTGRRAESYARMFVLFWNAFSGKKGDKISLDLPRQGENSGEGYVVSYFDRPTLTDGISNSLYMDLLSQAKDYAYFYTPYLMIGEGLMDAFVRAAARGVDVRIIMPGIPDKKLVYRMSRGYYRPLLAAGVKIFEYTPGFVHAKACIIDDEICTMGTVNLDYRSLFLHFENNSLFYKSPVVRDLKQDFLSTQEKCFERTTENINMGFFKWLIDGILRIFAPLC